MKKFIISIDAGTTSNRSILFDLKGKPIFSSQKEFTQYFPKSGWVEHNPDEIWKTTIKTLKDVIQKAKRLKGKILSIGITNQRETTVLWDKKTGKPVYRAIVWQDRRTNDICKKLIDQKLEEKVQKITGLIIDPYFSATKIKWILDNNPKAKRLIKEKKLLFGTIDTWLLWNLTERKSHLTDITNASRTMLYDLENEDWSHEILRSLNIPKDILPEVTQNTYDFGSTNLFGDSIPIGGMAGDQQASAIGLSCFKKGQTKSTYGTGCFLLMNIGEKFKLSSNNLITSVAFKIGNEKMYCFEGSIFVAGSAIQWLRDKLFFFKNAKQTELLYSEAKSSENVVIVPALTGLGAPHWNPNARGAIFGLTRNTAIPEIVKATLDSLAFQTFDLINIMEKDSNIKINEIYVDGGMADNKKFIQSLSDILQIEIIKPSNVEASALGAAYLAYINFMSQKNNNQLAINMDKYNVKESISFIPKIDKSSAKTKLVKWKKAVSALITFHS